jgi:hypothetical protein
VARLFRECLHRPPNPRSRSSRPTIRALPVSRLREVSRQHRHHPRLFADPCLPRHHRRRPKQTHQRFADQTPRYSRAPRPDAESRGATYRAAAKCGAPSNCSLVQRQKIKTARPEKSADDVQSRRRTKFPEAAATHHTTPRVLETLCSSCPASWLLSPTLRITQNGFVVTQEAPRQAQWHHG